MDDPGSPIPIFVAFSVPAGGGTYISIPVTSDAESTVNGLAGSRDDDVAKTSRI